MLDQFNTAALTFHSGWHVFLVVGEIEWIMTSETLTLIKQAQIMLELNRNKAGLSPDIFPGVTVKTVDFLSS